MGEAGRNWNWLGLVAMERVSGLTKCSEIPVKGLPVGCGTREEE